MAASFLADVTLDSRGLLFKILVGSLSKDVKGSSQRMNCSVVGQVGAIVRCQEIFLHQAQGQMLAGK